MPASSSTRQQQGAAHSQAAPQPDNPGGVHVKIKTRDSTSATRRAAVRQAGLDIGQLNQVTVGQVRVSTTRNPNVQPLRTSLKRAEFHPLSAAATAIDPPLSHQSAYVDSASAPAIQPRTLKLFSSQLPQQQLSPISEVAHASFSSSGFSRDAGYEGGSDDGCSIPDSALYTLSPPPSLHTGHVSRVSGDSGQTSSRSAASIQLHALSPVQRQAAPVYDACNGDTMIQNMAAIIADPAPMQVRHFHSLYCVITLHLSCIVQRLPSSNVFSGPLVELTDPPACEMSPQNSMQSQERGREQPLSQLAAAAQELRHEDLFSSSVLPQSPAVVQYPLQRASLELNRSSVEAAAQDDDIYCLLDNLSSASSSGSDRNDSSASFMRVGNAGVMLSAAGQGASSIMRAIDALKDGSRQTSTVQLHTRAPEAGNGLPFAGLIDAASGDFKLAAGTSSSHFVRNSSSDAINSQLPRLYPTTGPEMQIKRFWDKKKGCWCQRWVQAASLGSERQATLTAAPRKKNGVSFTVDTNLSPGGLDSCGSSGSGSKYRCVDSAPPSATSASSPQFVLASAASSKAENLSSSPSFKEDRKDGHTGQGDSSLHSGILFLGHDAKSIAASASAPHMWRSWGSAAVRVHARHGVSASCLYREIRAHAENLDDALHNLAESCSIWHHGYSVLLSRCAAACQRLHILRILRVLFNVWKRAVNVRTFTLKAARQRALQLPKLKHLVQSWRLLCLSSRVCASVASMFTTRLAPSLSSPCPLFVFLIPHAQAQASSVIQIPAINFQSLLPAAQCSIVNDDNSLDVCIRAAACSWQRYAIGGGGRCKLVRSRVLFVPVCS